MSASAKTSTSGTPMAAHSSEDEGAVLREFLNQLIADAPKAVSVAYSICRSRSTAEDVVQNAFVQILDHPPTVTSYRLFYTYFLKAVHGLTVDAMRTDLRRSQRESRRMTAVRGSTHDPLKNVERQELSDALACGMDELGQECREAVNLCCGMGLTSQEASEILGVPRSTVSERVQRGLGRLRQLLLKGGFACVGGVGLVELLQQEAARVVKPQLVAKLTQIAHARMSLAPPGAQGAVAAKTAALNWWVLTAVLALGAALGVAFWLQRESPTAQRPVTGLAEKVLVEDRFNRLDPDPFWIRREGKVALNDGRLCLEAPAGRSFRMESARLALNGNPICIVIGGAVHTPISPQSSLVVELLDAHAEVLFKMVYRNSIKELDSLDGSKIEKKEFYFGPETQPVAIPALRVSIAMVLDPGGWIAAFDSTVSDAIEMEQEHPWARSVCPSVLDHDQRWANAVCRSAGRNIDTVSVAITLHAGAEKPERIGMSLVRVAENAAWPEGVPRAEYTWIGLEKIKRR